MSVYIDGATLSFLLFCNTNGSQAQYGFLLGERIEQIEDGISDSQIHTANVNSYTYVSSFVPWPSPSSIYSRTGCLDEDLITELLLNTDQDIVGWYSYRHQTSLRPSLKEVTLHNNIASCQKFKGQPDELYFFLCSSSIQPNGSTHTYNHGFLSLVNGYFTKISMSVMNLGDTTRKEYRKKSNATLTHSSTLQKTFQKHRDNFVDQSDAMDQIVKVEQLAGSVNKSLMSMHSKLTKSEGKIGNLKTDVEQLRRQLESLEQTEIRLVFEQEDCKKKQEAEENVRKELELEDEEQSQLNKLMLDLGLTEQLGASSLEDQSSSQSASAKPLVPARKISIDLSSYVQIDIDKGENSENPEIVCWTEAPHTNGQQTSEEVMPKDGGKIENKASKGQQSSKPSTSASKDPFASLGDVGQLKRDLKLTDSDSAISKGKKGQSSNQRTVSTRAVSSEHTLDIKTTKIQSKLQKSGVKNCNFDINKVSSITDVNCSNGHMDADVNDSPGDNSTSDYNNFPDSPTYIPCETLPSASPLY